MARIKKTSQRFDMKQRTKSRLYHVEASTKPCKPFSRLLDTRCHKVSEAPSYLIHFRNSFSARSSTSSNSVADRFWPNGETHYWQSGPFRWTPACSFRLCTSLSESWTFQSLRILLAMWRWIPWQPCWSREHSAGLFMGFNSLKGQNPRPLERTSPLAQDTLLEHLPSV